MLSLLLMWTCVLAQAGRSSSANSSSANTSDPTSSLFSGNHSKVTVISQSPPLSAMQTSSLYLTGVSTSSGSVSCASSFQYTGEITQSRGPTATYNTTSMAAISTDPFVTLETAASLETSFLTPISLATTILPSNSPAPGTQQRLLYAVAGVAGGLFVALLIAIATIIGLVCTKRRHSKKLVFQHDSQALRTSDTSLRQFRQGNDVFDNPTYASSERNTEHPHKCDYFIETSQHDAAARPSEIPYASKFVSMESLGSISDQDDGSTTQDIVVPTWGQRNNIAENIIKGSSRHLYAILKNQQKTLVNVMTKKRDESSNFWRPSAIHDDLYQQLYEYKFLEIPRNKIKVLSYLRSEILGIVNKGIWQSPVGLKEVAIRLLHEGASVEEEVTFLQEAAIHGQFSSHPNVMQLHGLVTLRNPILIVMELLENDIKTYFTMQRSSPNPSTLLSFCQQIASGMKFLSDRKFVHRYLMAQCIYLTENGVCKIGGFGTSLLLESEDIRISHGISIPIRWSAPEVTHSRTYSSSSDVWSYGILLHEIWSVGRTPYEQLTEQEVVKAVDSGIRLDPPTTCPQAVYKIMIECWHPNPESRPSFGTICTQLCKTIPS